MYPSINPQVVKVVINLPRRSGRSEGGPAHAPIIMPTITANSTNIATPHTIISSTNKKNQINHNENQEISFPGNILSLMQNRIFENKLLYCISCITILYS